MQILSVSLFKHSTVSRDVGCRPFHHAHSYFEIDGFSETPMSSVAKKSGSNSRGRQSSRNKEKLCARDRIMIGISTIWPIAIPMPTYDNMKFYYLLIFKLNRCESELTSSL